MTEPVETFFGTVFPWHCDQFGHLNARMYAGFFDEAVPHLFRKAGMSYPQMQAIGAPIPVVAEITIAYLHEMMTGDMIVVESAFTKLGNKSIQRIARLYNGDTGVLCATERARDVFFDETTRRSAPMPDAVRVKLETLLVPDEEA